MLRQQKDQASNCVIRFVKEAMAPARYVQDTRRFDELRVRLNEPLALVAVYVNAKGEVARGAGRATTLDEVAKLAGRLRTELVRRSVHLEVTRYCEEELLRKSLFHAVFEATKGVGQRLRTLTGLSLDGADLVDNCFSTKHGAPLIQINPLTTESDRSEHRGFANLLKGVLGTFRNPPAHTPRATPSWTITEPDALDLFCTLSLIHRRLDNAIVAANPPSIGHSQP